MRASANTSCFAVDRRSRSASRRSARLIGSSLLVAVSLLIGPVACSTSPKASTSQASPKSPPQASSSPSSNPSPSPTSAPSPTPSEVSPTDAPTGSPTAMPGSIPSAFAGQPLNLDQAQSVSGAWEQSRYEVANRSDVAGMGVPVQSCSDTGGAVLEYRLADRFSSLRFSVSQANSSQSSDQLLTVVVMANGSQLDIQTVPFNQVKPLKYSVSGVNAMQIRLFLSDKVQRCGGSVTAVIEQLVVS